MVSPGQSMQWGSTRDNWLVQDNTSEFNQGQSIYRSSTHDNWLAQNNYNPIQICIHNQSIYQFTVLPQRYPSILYVNK